MEEINDPNSVTGDANDRPGSDPEDPTAHTAGTEAPPETGDLTQQDIPAITEPVEVTAPTAVFDRSGGEPPPPSVPSPPVGGSPAHPADLFPTYSPYSPYSFDSFESTDAALVSTSRRWIAVTIVVALLVAGGLGAGLGAVFSSSGPGQSSSNTTTPSAVSPSGISVSKVAAAAEPAIVDINTKIVTEVGDPTEEAAGTGMILTHNGEILTNNHVVEQATSIAVTIAGHSGSFPATVLGVDPTQDVALLKVQGFSDLPTVTTGNSSAVSVGEPVVAIGNALGYGGTPSVADGIISALDRTIDASDETSSTEQETLHGLLQTNAGIEPGDSGGPMLNAKSQVIGMDTAAASGDSDGTTVGFAIPINTALKVVHDIQNGDVTDGVVLGESPFLGVIEAVSTAPSYNYGGGVFGAPPTSTPTSSAGVQISNVVVSSPAQGAGLTGGDSITSVNGHATTTWTELTDQISPLHPGDQISLTYVDANGASHQATVRLAGIPK